MGFPLRIAFRYLFSKKSHNAVNVVSLVSACGIGVATMALVCVLSVYNGFEALLKGLFSEFDPDLKITLVEGKTFRLDAPEMEKIRQMEQVEYFSPVLEENALVRHREKQQPVLVKGVSDAFDKATNIREIIISGQYVVTRGENEYAVAGAGLAMATDMNINFLSPITLYAPKRTGRVNLANPESGFRKESLFVSGVFGVKQAEYDDKYLLVPLALAQRLFEYDEQTASAIELKIADAKAVPAVKKEIRNLLGENFCVLDKYEQQGEFFRIMKMEKWISYLILSFILLIAVFNIIGSLSMLIVEKKEDISVFLKMGASRSQVRRIFVFEGWLVSALGSAVGIVVGVILCCLQKSFGIIRLAGADENFIISVYPVEVRALDLLFVLLTVLAFAFFSVIYPTRFISRK